MPNSFVTVKEVALMRKALAFKASVKEDDNERKEEKVEQCRHEVMEVIVSTKGESGTARQEPPLIGSYDLSSDVNLGHSQVGDTTSKEGTCEDERKKGKQLKEENEYKYPESQCSHISVAGPSGIDKEPHHTHNVSGPESRMTSIRKDQKEININTPQDNVHTEDVEQSDDFSSYDLLCCAWQISNGMVSRVSHETQLKKIFVAVETFVVSKRNYYNN